MCTSSITDRLPSRRIVEVILPGFDVHQNFDSVLMNGGRNGKGNGTDSAIHG